MEQNALDNVSRIPDFSRYMLFDSNIKSVSSSSYEK